MAINGIALTSSMRTNLVGLQATAEMMAQTQQRLSTGRKVNSAIDNPSSYFSAQAHTQRADLLTGLKDSISEAIQSVKAADNGIKAVTSLTESLRGIVSQARSALNSPTSGTELASMATQYNGLVKQLNEVAGDSGYKSVNFLKSTTVLSVNFNENSTTSLSMSGFDSSASGLTISGGSATGVGTIASTDLDTSAELDAVETSLNAALSTLRSESSKQAANLSVLTARSTFITDMVNTLQEGAGNLVNADTNVESANMLMLQTRQQLGTTSLSLASQAAQSVLRLF